KMLFVKYPELLKRLVAVLLGIPLESIEHFQTINTEMPPEEIGKKFCRLDINMIVDGKRVNLEIQVENEGNYPERSMFHWAKIFTSSLPAGDDYSLLPKTIVISILGFEQFDCEEVHSEFAPLEVKRHEILSDKQRYHFYELPKLPDVDSIDTTSEKDLWLALFNAETEEELEKLISSGGEVMSQAVEAYRGITATEEFKYLEILRARAGHDEAQAIRNAERRGEQRGAETERQKWQSVVETERQERQSVAEENEQLRQELAEFRAQRANR
ncbi:MAG: Rpn family recombination-promoting nuclease/putative transposase, partial [Synergistaceae bacterium]|nr:Rpn family recombination-promoting nuclease/putative transposase [Synergistaceae bacterium]